MRAGVLQDVNDVSFTTVADPVVESVRYPSILGHCAYCAREGPLTCARVVLYGKLDMVPLARPVAEVCAVARKDMESGDTLDAIGEYCYRAWIMTAADAREAQAIPCGLLHGATVTQPIAKGQLITTANAAVPQGSKIAALRARQDRLVYGQ